ncbi:g6267 [Coccomyxa elongata]
MQVNAALERGIDCEVFNSTVSESKKIAIISELCSGAPCTKLLYTTPESLALPQLRDALKEAHAASILRFAVDEAHCVSQWGHDFRPTYLTLSTLHADFPGASIMACTATATKQVKASIIELLDLRSPVVLESSFNRSNLRYEVRYKELIGDGSDAAALEDLVAFIKLQPPGTCGIIYAHQRKTCDWLGSSLCDADVEAMTYHAGKDPDQRARAQSQWSEGDVDIVVATIAFGMGVDKPDVRWVVHWDASSSLEGYSQESGRAGRDGLPSVCIMYASKAHFEQMRKMERGERAGSTAAVAGMALSACCRRKALLEHFGERRGRCITTEEELCDFCQSPEHVAATVARLEGAWQSLEADAAQLGGADENGDAEQQPHGTGTGAVDRKARTPAKLGQPVRKRSRLQTQATWNSARELCASIPSRPQYQADQSSGLDTSTAEPVCTMNATDTSWQHEQDIAAPAGEIAENSSVCRSVQPVKPLLLARKCISTGPLSERSPDPVKQQRFVSGLRRRGFKCPLKNQQQ